MEYLWLSIYVKLDYLTYIHLLKVFKNVNNIYEFSKDSKNFVNILKVNNIQLNYNWYTNLISEKLKDKVEEKYNDLIKNNIKIIDINSKYYPKELVNIINSPICIFAYGDIELLNNKKFYVYSSDYDSNYSKKTIYEFCKCLKKNNIRIVSDCFTGYSDIVYLPYIQKIDEKNILVISDKIEQNSFVNYEYITGISCALFVIESSYNHKAIMIVDSALEQGKDILVIPGRIYDKEAYFSNCLIRDGAICITSKLDLLTYIK